MAVYLALDLILKHAAGLGQLTRHDEDLAAVDELAVLGTKPFDRQRICALACSPAASVRNEIPVLRSVDPPAIHGLTER